MDPAKVFALGVFSGLILGKCQRGDLRGVPLELILARLADLEARVEDRFENSLVQLISRMEELERNVMVSCSANVVINAPILPHYSDYISKLPALCRGGKWTVIQRRLDGSENFFRNWAEYKRGFGDIRGEFWMGLEFLYRTIRAERHELLVVLEDFAGTLVHACYDDFHIGSEADSYTLEMLGEYCDTAGDSLRDHLGMPFSTRDKDSSGEANDCASRHRGAWWFNASKYCIASHLNGEYSKTAKVAEEMGLNWYEFRGDFYSLKSCEMMIRRVDS
ncbi:AGAP012000-PA-like protein [Anopheles sinensis]|uniref:AGAP012000-PA-like protein n=1 Tax=Anopheles sinensis TaxID=74873 RepID=A0A084VSU6_ANOSI|nr:AGAP012000-PA-like protein [Anopheles sinensis]